MIRRRAANAKERVKNRVRRHADDTMSFTQTAACDVGSKIVRPYRLVLPTAKKSTTAIQNTSLWLPEDTQRSIDSSVADDSINISLGPAELVEAQRIQYQRPEQIEASNGYLSDEMKEHLKEISLEDMTSEQLYINHNNSEPTMSTGPTIEEAMRVLKKNNQQQLHISDNNTNNTQNNELNDTIYQSFVEESILSASVRNCPGGHSTVVAGGSSISPKTTTLVEGSMKSVQPLSTQDKALDAEDLNNLETASSTEIQEPSEGGATDGPNVADNQPIPISWSSFEKPQQAVPELKGRFHKAADEARQVVEETRNAVAETRKKAQTLLEEVMNHQIFHDSTPKQQHQHEPVATGDEVSGKSSSAKVEHGALENKPAASCVVTTKLEKSLRDPVASRVTANEPTTKALPPIKSGAMPSHYDYIQGHIPAIKHLPMPEPAYLPTLVLSACCTPKEYGKENCTYYGRFK